MIGAMAHYIENGGTGDFVPMNANFGIVEPLPMRVKGGKEARYEVVAARALEEIETLKPVVKEGQSARHGASLIDTNIRTIGRIKTPFSVYNKLLGYSANSNNPQID